MVPDHKKLKIENSNYTWARTSLALRSLAVRLLSLLKFEPADSYLCCRPLLTEKRFAFWFGLALSVHLELFSRKQVLGIRAFLQAKLVSTCSRYSRDFTVNSLQMVLESSVMKVRTVLKIYVVFLYTYVQSLLENVSQQLTPVKC